MKNTFLIVALFLISNIFVQCDCLRDHHDNDLCYEFDRRQCDGDEWSDIVPLGDSADDQETKMKAYLEDKGIDIEDITLVQNFHEFVCEACVVCPQGDRFFIQIVDEEDVNILEELELLNFEEAACNNL
ncbi:hypothetical protein [Portibacter marinus]|uniref:hypothetical protein n=1 Tax=Portibacter marinus TaxID=2898660 RepID=UPI001F21A39A|nr:hypothetical protein [Portibacter marinus]